MIPAANISAGRLSSAPPTWAVVFTRPEARPASCAVALDMASVISAGKHRPAPVPISSVTGKT